jgi:hypothetical protein
MKNDLRSNVRNQKSEVRRQKSEIGLLFSDICFLSSVIGVVLLIAMILVLRLNAFVALISSAMVVNYSAKKRGIRH